MSEESGLICGPCRHDNHQRCEGCVCTFCVDLYETEEEEE